MTERYRVTHVAHYIGGRLIQPGRGDESIVTLPAGVKPGRWLEPLEAVSRQPVTQPVSDVAAAFEAQHIGGGKWAVVQLSDESRVSELMGKDAAKEEAARLNAGGLLAAKTGDTADTDPGNLPDA